MAANTSPIFSKVPANGTARVTAANTSSDGGGTIGTDIFLLFTAGAEGAYLDRVRWIPVATTPTTTTATVGRVYRSTKTSGATTNADTFLLGEITLPAIAAGNASAAAPYFELPFGIGLAPNETLLVTTHAAPAANTAWRVHSFGGSY